MIVECLSMLAIIVCMIVIFVRAGHTDYAFSLAPLLFVPAMHLVGNLLLSAFPQTFSFAPAAMILACVDILSVAAACLLTMLLSFKIKSKKNKRLYIFLLSGYNVILACVFVINMLWPFLENNF